MAQRTKAETAPDADSEAQSPQIAEVVADPPAPEPIVAKPAKRRGFAPLLLGGMIAAALGAGATYYAARYSAPATDGSGVAALSDRLTAQDAQIATLTETLAALPGPSGSDEATAQALEDITARQQALEASLKDLSARIERIENTPVGTAGGTALDVAAATEAATKAARLAEEEAAKLKAEAEAATRRATLVAATGQLAAALETGTALQPALDLLAQSGVTIPAGLADVAQGAPTLRALRDTFPPAARDALALSLRETADGSLWSRFSAFVRSQTGARSLTPVAGTDPDAILSRAEAALTAGDLAAALTEIAGLPPEGQARMAEWAGLAGKRLAALSAMATLTGEVGQ